MGIVGIPIVGYAVPDAFEKNLMIVILSECGLSRSESGCRKNATGQSSRPSPQLQSKKYLLKTDRR